MVTSVTMYPARKQHQAARDRACCCFKQLRTYSFALRATGEAAFFGCFCASSARCPWIDWRSNKFRLMSAPLPAYSGRLGKASWNA
jgi:hypothetical protein